MRGRKRTPRLPRRLRVKAQQAMRREGPNCLVPLRPPAPSLAAPALPPCSGFTIDKLSDPVYWTDRDGTILKVNDAACRATGFPREELLQLSIADLEILSSAPDGCFDWQALKRDAIVRYRTVHLKKEGASAPVEVLAYYLCCEGEEFGCVVARDISAQVAAEERLKASEEEFRVLFEASSDAIFWVEAESGTVIRCNEAAEKMLELPRGEIIGKHHTALHPPEKREYFAARFAEKVRGTGDIDDEALVCTASGKVIPVQIKHSQSRIGARVIAQGVFSDISEREFRRNEDLKAQKLSSLGVLAGGIAHDFNNLLTGILGNLSLARMFLDDAHHAMKPLAYAERASLRAAELAAQLLTFAKGGVPVKKETSVRRILEESMSFALRGANVKGDLAISDLLHGIEADEGQMGQVFHNLILNAVQAMPGGGVLAVRARNHELRPGNRFTLPPGPYVLISFADEGGGIASEDQKKIFDPYFTTRPGSAGLGLTSVYSIVKKHGGAVEVTSWTGEGTVVNLYLPSVGRTLPEKDKEKPAAAPARPHSGAILVMDDEEMIRGLTSRMLQHLGYQVTTCTSGEEAITLYRRAREDGRPYVVTIMDLTIPGGMGGKEAAEQILSYDPAARLIVSSGYSNDPVIAEHASYGFCAAVVKPFKIEEIVAVLAELPAGNSAPPVNP